MNPPNKSTHSKSLQQQLKQRPAPGQRHAAQPKNVVAIRVQPQTGNKAHTGRPPVAPPKYCPQPVPKVLQTKKASQPNASVATPANRPQPRARAIQPANGSGRSLTIQASWDRITGWLWPKPQGVSYKEVVHDERLELVMQSNRVQKEYRKG